jgi:rSAM/selenodomain-associated transferase 2
MLSIIVPALNEADNIVRTLNDLQPLRERGHEVLVVDGGSTDATPRLAEPLSDRVLTSGRGRALQMNAGAAASRGDVLWFVHADSQVSTAALMQLEQAVAAGALWGRFDVRLAGESWMLPMVAWMMNRRSCITGIATGDQGMFVRRTAFEAAGGFPDIPLMEDVALSRALKRLARPHCLPGPLITSARRWEAQGVWRTILLMWRLRLEFALGADPAVLHRRYYRR